jgi:hypothetical protein
MKTVMVLSAAEKTRFGSCPIPESICLQCPRTLPCLEAASRLLALPPRLLALPPRLLALPPRLLALPPRPLALPPRPLALPQRLPHAPVWRIP